MFYVTLGRTVVARFFEVTQAVAYLNSISDDERAVWDYQIVTEER